MYVMLPVTGKMENITVLLLKQSAQMCKCVQELKSLTVPLSSNVPWSAHACQSVSTPLLKMPVSPVSFLIKKQQLQKKTNNI